MISFTGKERPPIPNKEMKRTGLSVTFSARVEKPEAEPAAYRGVRRDAYHPTDSFAVPYLCLGLYCPAGSSARVERRTGEEHPDDRAG